MKLTHDELRKLRNAYNVQKKTARRRKDRSGNQIGMQMTFEQWLDIWLQSGKLAERGRGPGKYVMGRNDDLGPYAVGNVTIITWEENSRLAKLGRPASHKGRVSPMKGKTHSEETRRLQSQRAIEREARKRYKRDQRQVSWLHTRFVHGRSLLAEPQWL